MAPSPSERQAVVTERNPVDPVALRDPHPADLFDGRGFEKVSIEDIAAAAEVSPSSVYRYFGTKERIVLHDEVDLRFVDAVDASWPTTPRSKRCGGPWHRSCRCTSTETTNWSGERSVTPMRNPRCAPHRSRWPTTS